VESKQGKTDMSATNPPLRNELSVLAVGTASGVVCFLLFQSAYWLTAWLSRLLPTLRLLSENDRWLLRRSEPGKMIGAGLVLLIALAATSAWDRIRIRYRLDARRYWAMIGLALSICLLVALLTGGV
jgi:hypothetical protein